MLMKCRVSRRDMQNAEYQGFNDRLRFQLAAAMLSRAGAPRRE